jgi:hypothetical protein
MKKIHDPILFNVAGLSESFRAECHRHLKSLRRKYGTLFRGIVVDDEAVRTRRDWAIEATRRPRRVTAEFEASEFAKEHGFAAIVEYNGSVKVFSPAPELKRGFKTKTFSASREKKRLILFPIPNRLNG